MPNVRIHLSLPPNLESGMETFTSKMCDGSKRRFLST